LSESLDQDQRRLAILEGWLERIRRVRKLRRWAVEPIPDEFRPVYSASLRDKAMLFAIECSRTLRYAAWTGRSDVKSDDPTDKILQYGKPHYKMACDWYIARQKAFFFYGNVFFHRDGKSRHRSVQWSVCYNKARLSADYAGVLLIYPPRHSKTTFLRHAMALEFCEDPRMQSAYVHARDKEASKFLQYVSDLFRRDNAAGRRNLAMFPDLKLANRDNNATRFRLDSEDPPSNPTMISSGIGASAQGNNFDLLATDDVVSSNDQDSQAHRQLTKSRLRGTWFTRVQGKSGGFVVCAGYPWHQDDAMWEMMKSADEAKRTFGRRGIKMLESKMAVGGPKQGFTPIWPQMYDKVRLKAIYERIGPATYNAQYMMEPLSEDMKIVKKVRLYDPKPMRDPDQHVRFVENCDIHLSIDPSFTNTATSDFAGVVTLGVGEVLEELVVSDTGERRASSRVAVRVLDVVEMKSTTSEMIDYILEVSRSRNIDVLHIESAGGGIALVQALEDAGISNQVVTHSTGNKNKEVRLRNVAMLLEDGAPGLRAKVEFLGRREDDKTDEHGRRIEGELLLDPSMKKLVDYVENFKIASGYHSLDALTQAVRHIGEHYGFGRGAAISLQAQMSPRVHMTLESRISRHLREQTRQSKMPVDSVIPSDQFRSMLGNGGI